MGAEEFQVGKLPMPFLQTMLARYGGQDERLIVGPGIGEDAVVVDMGDRYLVAKSDPITFATDEIGWYVVHINANDLATVGATPRWLLLTLLLPETGTDGDLVETIFAQTSQACQELGVVLSGGHTEVTYGLERPLAVGFMLGEVDKADLVYTAGVRAGDDVILTKGIAIEGTAVLAREMGERLAARLGPDLVARGRRLLRDPGISVVEDARIICAVGKPSAMHDPTEGGLSTGLWELAWASGKKLVIDLARVHVYPETAAFCRELDLDPIGLIASGALLVTAPPDRSGRMVSALLAAGIQATIIGRVEEGPAGVQVQRGEGLVPLPTFERDELGRVFGPTAMA